MLQTKDVAVKNRCVSHLTEVICASKKNSMKRNDALFCIFLKINFVLHLLVYEGSELNSDVYWIYLLY